MAEASVPVDLFNPGQVFACLGLMELVDTLCDGVEAVFDWSCSTNTRFHLRTNGEDHPVAVALDFLAKAKVVAEAPHASSNLRAWTASWGEVRERAPHAPYPFPDPDSPATLIAVLEANGRRIVIDHWGDATERDTVKFWAGAGGYPGSALARNALELGRTRCRQSVSDPFALAAPQSSSFRFDARSSYIPIHTGFSLNKQDLEMLGYPLVDVLAAIGLGEARPKRLNKLEYCYGVAGRDDPSFAAWLPPSLLRAALGGASLPLPQRRFRMLLGMPDKESRVITTVSEENDRERD